MTIAIACKGLEIASHFGHCDGCVVYFLDNQQIVSEKYIVNPQGKEGCSNGNEAKKGCCSCSFFSLYLLNKIKVDTVIAGEIGGIAAANFSQQGIKTVTGVKGKITKYLQGILG